MARDRDWPAIAGQLLIYPVIAADFGTAKAFVAAGVPTIHRDYEGAIHGFITMASLGICTRAREQAWADIWVLLSRSSE